MIKLSYIKSNDRQYNIERCLSLIKTEITKGLKDAKSVVIKPDCTVPDNQLACTHADAIRSVLSMIRPHVKGQITLAESSTVGEIGIAFQNYDYYKLQDPYDLAIVDLNTDDTEKIELVDRNNKTWNARISRTLVKSDYIISVCPPKAHNKIGYTGAINNISFASLHQPKKSLKRFLGIGQDRNDKNYAYDSKKAVHQNIQRIASKLKVRLAVIDAFEIMEGNGPLHGEMVAGHFSIAGTDALSADILTCQCLGLDYNKISYLNLMEPSNPENYFVVGDDWKKNPLSIRQQTN